MSSIWPISLFDRLAGYGPDPLMEWQKDCPGCGKTYPLLHTVKDPVVRAPKGRDTRVFVLESWPDSYLYISQDTLKEWKKLGLTGIESLKKPFGVLEGA